ncbi:hypothetical protein [Streptomyces melanogenes]|uniref:hypothetical protein n=1 Tax=Streptomyces melanogenes TaxID=67326 RepID=UPI00167D69EC|nr:hypothetical protein [Streptomyces melanogenes]GGP86294.1 hypothetical protein GCM10010278_75850 [Streptomyces melanogenes]
MKAKNVCPRLRHALVAAGAAVVMTAVPAHPAEAAYDVPSVEFGYRPLQFSEDGGRVTVIWHVENTGDRPVHDLVLTHRIKPELPVAAVAPPCARQASSIVCPVGDLEAGEHVGGTIVAKTPAGRPGSVEVSGYASWR